MTSVNEHILCSKFFIYANSFSPQNNPMGRYYYYTHFTGPERVSHLPEFHSYSGESWDSNPDTPPLDSTLLFTVYAA